MNDGKGYSQVGGDRERVADGNRFWARCHDRWALVSFLVSSVIYLVLSIYCLYCMATDYDDLSDIDVPGNWTVTTSEVKRVKRTEIDFDQAFNKLVLCL